MTDAGYRNHIASTDTYRNHSLRTVFTRYRNFLIALEILTDTLCKFCARHVWGGVTN
jgi:hypothetical protein